MPARWRFKQVTAVEVKTHKGTDALGRAIGVNETQTHKTQGVRHAEVRLEAESANQRGNKPLPSASFPGKPTLGLRGGGLTGWIELHPQRQS